MSASTLTLTAAGREVRTVFDLLGRRENDLTYALGWGLANAPRLGAALLRDIFDDDVGDLITVALQESGEDRGFTDIELQAERAHVILEAKRGWIVPTLAQFTRYTPRLVKSENPKLLALTECSPAFARRRLPESVGGVPLEHRSWTDIVRLVEGSAAHAGQIEKRLLRELGRYLRGVMTMQNVTSNWTWCVVLSPRGEPGWEITFLDVVRERNRYFHPYGAGRGWPKVPPNYIAFRWGGRVRRVHHVDGYAVVDDLNDVFPEIPPNRATYPHIVYELGPAIELPNQLPSRGVYATARVWVALDLLFTAPTLKEAITATKARRTAEPDQPA